MRIAGGPFTWILVVLSILPVVRTVQADHVDEYLLKAAMVRNFARFVRWPDDSRSLPDGEPLWLCIMGDDRVADGFSNISDKKVNGRFIDMDRVDRVSAISSCDILFVSRTTTTHPTRIIEAASAGAMLTVGETEEFARAGGMIIFKEEDGRIGFQINLKATRGAGLTVSSTLLELAIIIDPASAGEETR